MGLNRCWRRISFLVSATLAAGSSNSVRVFALFTPIHSLKAVASTWVMIDPKRFRTENNQVGDFFYFGMICSPHISLMGFANPCC